MHRTLCINWNWMCSKAHQLINPCLLLLLRKGAEPRERNPVFKASSFVQYKTHAVKIWSAKIGYTLQHTHSHSHLLLLLLLSSSSSKLLEKHPGNRDTSEQHQTASFLDTFQLTSWVFRSLRSLIWNSSAAWIHEELWNHLPLETHTHCTKIDKP